MQQIVFGTAGHIDHGKTALVKALTGENTDSLPEEKLRGISIDIGFAYLNERISIIDVPGHEKFIRNMTAGAAGIHFALIVVAADDGIMPQTKEAISHAQAGGVPIIFAINKIDKEGANPDKLKESLASMNLVVEDWGGKIQSQDISALSGKGIDELLEKVLLEAEIMDLKANPDKLSTGTILEAYLDKGGVMSQLFSFKTVHSK